MRDDEAKAWLHHRLAFNSSLTQKKLCNVASPLTNEKASLLKVGVARVKKAISNVVRWLDLKLPQKIIC